jgi:hypothetical protein
LAEHIDGIDLSRRSVGELIDLSQHDAEMLVAEGWAFAVPVTRNGDRRRAPADAANGSARQEPKRRT